jgi:hypothetical protein
MEQKLITFFDVRRNRSSLERLSEYDDSVGKFQPIFLHLSVQAFPGDT